MGNGLKNDAPREMPEDDKKHKDDSSNQLASGDEDKKKQRDKDEEHTGTAAGTEMLLQLDEAEEKNKGARNE